MLWLVPNLPLVAAASTTCIFTLLLHHITCVLASIAVGFVIRKQTEKERQLEAFAKRGLVGRSIGLVSMLLTTALRLLAQLASACTSLVLMLLPIIIISCVMALVQLRWGATLRSLNATLVDDGQLLRTLVLAPFAFLAEVLLYTAPIYNLIMYIFIHAPIDVVIWILRGLDARLLVSGLTSLLGACRPIAGAFGDFVRANPYSCGDMTQLPNCTLVEDASVECTGTPGYLTAAHVCLDPGLRRIDLSGATTLVQSGLLDATRALGSLDPNLRRALNGLLYPITDTGTWTALQVSVADPCSKL